MTQDHKRGPENTKTWKKEKALDTNGGLCAHGLKIEDRIFNSRICELLFTVRLCMTDI